MGYGRDMRTLLENKGIAPEQLVPSDFWEKENLPYKRDEPLFLSSG